MDDASSDQHEWAAAAAAAPPPDGAWGAWLRTSLQRIRDAKLERVLRPLVPTDSPTEALIHPAEHDAWVAGQPSPGAGAHQALGTQVQQQPGEPRLRRLVLFSTNDYLGLSSHPAVRAAAAAAATCVGNGPRSSALVGGFTSEHRQLERELARLKGTPDALLFPSGYAANTAAVAVLAAPAPHSLGGGWPQPGGAQRGAPPPPPPEVVVFSDELNHASLIDGARLAMRGAPGGGRGRVSLAVYRHADLAHLESLLAAAPRGCRKLVITDGLFSMDGDFAPLQGLAALKARHGFLLLVDDAHGTLVAGRHGGGTAQAQGAEAAVDVTTGTLSKAAGALGGFVACSSELRALLLNAGRPVVFSTALPVPVVAAARAALAVSHSERWRRDHLRQLMRLMARRLGVAAASPIVPLVVGSEAHALELSSRLLASGYHVPAIRPPTVPPGTCRLRVSLSAAHTAAQVDGLIDALQAAMAALPGVVLQPLPHLAGSLEDREHAQAPAAALRSRL